MRRCASSTTSTSHWIRRPSRLVTSFRMHSSGVVTTTVDFHSLRPCHAKCFFEVVPSFFSVSRPPSFLEKKRQKSPHTQTRKEELAKTVKCLPVPKVREKKNAGIFFPRWRKRFFLCSPVKIKISYTRYIGAESKITLIWLLSFAFFSLSEANSISYVSNISLSSCGNKRRKHRNGANAGFD